MTALREDLIGVRDLIEQGWTQGVNVRIDADGSCSFCLLGALYEHVSRDFRDSGARMRHVEDLFGGVRAMLDFNETPGRTQTQVIQRLDLEIAKLEKSDGR